MLRNTRSQHRRPAQPGQRDAVPALAPTFAPPPCIRIPLPALDFACGSTRYRLRPVELVAEVLSEAPPVAPSLPPAPTRSLPPPGAPHAPSAPPPSPLAPRPAGYSLRKGFGVWHLVFDGRETLLRHERGLLYVAWLLYHPPAQPLHALDLVAKIPDLYRAQLGLGALASHARLQERSLSLDNAHSLRALRRQEQELEAILDNETATEPEKAEALRDLEALLQFQRDHGRRSRQMAERAVDTVRKAVRRFHANLAAVKDAAGAPHPVLRAFAAHLDQYLLIPSGRYASGGGRYIRRGLAGCFTYEPPPGVKWGAEAER